MAGDIKGAAFDLGFEAVGICDLRPVERDALQRWLDAGYAGEMTYMHRQAAKRTDPSTIAGGAKRAVVTLASYYQSRAASLQFRVARYAWGEDYHEVVGKKLEALARLLVNLGSSPRATRWYVDAGPVPERELAQRAGLGWIAKNTMLIHPQIGSFTFIGVVFTDLELPVDEPFTSDHCGNCRSCLDACPTKAFPAERVLDARRCISYLTIELRRPFRDEEKERIGNWLFGCDVCQDVCPWNEKFACATREPRFAAREEIVHPDPHSFANMDGATFRRLYGRTALKRAGLAGLRRNAAQVLANTRC